jgi:hypothetical protein
MFFAKPRLVGALKHNQSYQDASPSIHFSDRTVLLGTSSGIMFTAFTRLRLVSDGRRPTMLVLDAAFPVTLKSNLPLESAVQFDRV